ncbi:MAG: DUF2254 domain-containing protein [Bowdeniella nasicola]|nr:DUF2254 domain-containing protein [Bowdeniella nasicola]
MHALTKLRNLASDRIWFAPLLAAIGAAITAIVLSNVYVPSEYVLARFLWPGDNSAAADMLSFIASSMLTVLTTTISMTLIVLQVASGQYSSQLLRDYIQSRAVRGIFAVFIGVFVYSLLLLRSVEAQTRDKPPQIGIAVAMLLVLAALATFVWYVSRVVAMVRVDSIIEAATQRIENLYREHRKKWSEPHEVPEIPEHARPVRANESGYVRSISMSTAARWAQKNDAVLVIAVAPGDPVIAGQTVAWAFARTGTLDDDVQLPGSVVYIEHERVSDADIRLGMHQLSDIAVRALSPGTNDPTTAVHAINQAISIARMIADRPLHHEWLADDDGILRAFAPAPSTIDFLQEIVGPVRRYATAEPAVLIQLLRLLAVVEEGTESAEVIAMVRAERRRIVESARELMVHDDDFEMVEEMSTLRAVRRSSRITGPEADIVDDIHDQDDASESEAAAEQEDDGERATDDPGQTEVGDATEAHPNGVER